MTKKHSIFGDGLHRRDFLRGAAATATGISAAAVGIPQSRAAEELNALVWCDHTDDRLRQPFENAHDVSINMKSYEGTGIALSLIEQSQPGDWDVFVVNANDVPWVVSEGVLAEIPSDAFAWDDFFPEVRQPGFHYVDDKLYAVPEKFGYQALAYNKAKVDPDDMQSYESVWDEKYKGRVAVYDYYSTIIQMIGLTMGLKPEEVAMEHLPAIREKLLALKAQTVLTGDVVSVQNAIVAESVDIIFGGSEYVVSGITTAYPDLDWVLPKEGGLLWTQSIGVFADSTRKDSALEFVNYIVSPEGQHELATSDCYWAMPANSRTPLSDFEKAALRWDQQPGFLANSYPYIYADPELDAAMLDLWTEYLAA